MKPLSWIIIIAFLSTSFGQNSATTQRLEREIASYENLLSSRSEELNDIDEKY